LILLRAKPVWGDEHEIRGRSTRIQQVIYELAGELADRWLSEQSPLDGTDAQFTRRGTLFIDAKRAINAWISHPNVGIKRLDLLNRPNIRPIVLQDVASACVTEDGEPAHIVPKFKDEREWRKSTNGTDFITTLKNKLTNLNKSHLNTAACHSDWEVRVAKLIDTHDAVHSWVRNFRLNWRIPWWDRQLGYWREYEPDFVVRVQTKNDTLSHHIVVEVKGVEKEPSNLKKGNY